MTDSATKVRLALAQYQPIAHADWASYAARIEQWVAEAAEVSAELLVFPEYAGLEVVSLLPANLPVAEQFAQLQQFANDYCELFRQLAGRYQVTVVAGSFPVIASDQQFYNRAWICLPDGSTTYQDKLLFVHYENTLGCLKAGDQPRVVATPFGMIGVCICYDSEFPLLARQLVDQGAWLIVVPSCTETTAGYYRVRIACQARALENQCYVAQAVLIGNAEWSDPIDTNTGSAAVYCPPDVGMPSDGIVVAGTRDQPSWVYADLDAETLAAVRNQGAVRNYSDWPLQAQHLAPPCEKS